MVHSKDALKGKIQTVIGLIDPNELGVTLSHEHCLIDVSRSFHEPEEEYAKKIAYQPVSLDNVGFIRYHVHDNVDNLKLLDEWQAVNELKMFKDAGGGAIIDASNVDHARDPLAIKRISTTTGLNVVMGAGYYVKSAQNLPLMEKRTEDDIAEEIIRDILEGVGDSGVHAGSIGEIGCSYPIEDCEKKVLRASAIAAKETGAPLMVHPGRNEESPAEIIKVLKEMGANLEHTVISHIERTLFKAKNRYRLAEEGCHMAYDLFGEEGYYPDCYVILDIINDAQRIAQIKDMIAHGFGKQIQVSYDLAYKNRYMCYGGHGYTHILHNVVPAMRNRDMTEDQINDLLINNPKEFYTFK